MRKVLILFLTVCPLVLTATEVETVKQTILARQQALKTARSESEKSQIFYELALALYQDQEADQAFCHFLEALKRIDKIDPPAMCAEEKEIYDLALAEYLTAAADSGEVAQTLLAHHGDVAANHPEYFHLNFVVALAYANLGKFDIFFERFYRSYPYLKDHYLAYKTEGILYLRLASRTPDAKVRQAFQQAAASCLEGALARNPQDGALYKILMTMAKEEKNDPLFLSYLKKSVMNQATIQRGDVFLYVREAVAFGEFEIGQAIIDQAQVQYAYSRAIGAAQEYLNQNKR